MINAQHAHIYRIHPLHFIFGEIFFLKILSIQPLVEACRASDGANQCPGRYMGGAEKGGNENQFPYSLPTTKFFEFRWGQRRNWCVSFSPVTPPPDFVSKTFLGDITFSPRSIREPDNSSQTHPPLPVCIGLDSVGVSATWVHFHLIPVNAGHAGNLFPFPLFVSPPTPYNLDGRAHQPPLVATAGYLG